MNVAVAVAGVLTAIAFFAHTVVGAMEFRHVRPVDDTEKSALVRTQSLSGWHMVSVDLGAAAAILLTIAFADVLPHEDVILWVLAGYFSLWGLAWLITVVTTGRHTRHAVWKLPQWIFCFVVAALAVVGAG